MTFKEIKVIARRVDLSDIGGALVLFGSVWAFAYVAVWLGA